jgi:hypothetical protein
VRLKNLKLTSQQYRALSACKDVLADLALYWWQRLLTFAFSMVNWLKWHFVLLYQILNHLNFNNDGKPKDGSALWQISIFFLSYYNNTHKEISFFRLLKNDSILGF